MNSSETSKTNKTVKLPPVARRLIRQHAEKKSCFARSFYGRFEKTRDFLRWKAECNSLSDKLNYIASELEREKLYALYRRLFPKEWKRSTASFTETSYNEQHTEREFEFIELVSDRLFPLNTWLDWSDFRFDYIPIEPLNFDFCCEEYELHEFRPCLQFGVIAFLWRNADLDDENWRELLGNFKVPVEALPPIKRETPLFVELHRHRNDSKIRRFLHLIEFIFHDSGNAFIDTTYCQPLDLYEWSLENIENLEKQHKAANEYFSSLHSIDEDIERDAHSTFEELIGIWNTRRLPECGEKQFERDEDHALLINILAGSEEIPEPALAF